MRGSMAEAGAGLAFDVGGVALFWNAGNDQRGIAPARSAAITAVGDGHLRTVSAQSLDLLESGFDRVPVIIVFRQTVGTQDDATVLADHKRRLGSELVFFMLLSLGQVVNMRLVEGVNLVRIVLLLLQHSPGDGKPVPVRIAFGHTALQLAHDLPGNGFQAAGRLAGAQCSALRATPPLRLQQFWHRARKALPQNDSVPPRPLDPAPHDLGREFRVGGEGDVLLIRCTSPLRGCPPDSLSPLRSGSCVVVSTTTSFSLAFSPCNAMEAAKIFSAPPGPILARK